MLGTKPIGEIYSTKLPTLFPNEQYIFTWLRQDRKPYKMQESDKIFKVMLRFDVKLVNMRYFLFTVTWHLIGQVTRVFVM